MEVRENLRQRFEKYKMLILYKDKEEMFMESFGWAWQDKQLIHIQKDLPRTVEKFVLLHEKYHLKDTHKRYWWWREIKANVYAGIRSPIGFIATCFLALIRGQHKLYIERFKRGF